MSIENREALDRLIEEAKEDPELFHRLVFSPEEVLEEVDYLDKRAKATLIELKPENVLGGLIGVRPRDSESEVGRVCRQTAWCGDTRCGPGYTYALCGETCTHTISAPEIMEESFQRQGPDIVRPFRGFQPRKRSYY